jgi:lactoylglutathione lyase
MHPARLIPVLIALLLPAVPAKQPTQAGPREPVITGINHVAFRVSDVAAARSFYEGVLGLSLAESPPGKRLQYIVGHRQSVVLEPGLRPDDDERFAHIAYDTPDVKALSAHLAARGIEVRQPPERCREDAVWVLDPEGHSVEFVESAWPPAVPAPSGSRAISTRLLHAGVVVRHEERAHAFYREILGFSETWRGGRTAGITQWVNMRVPGGTDYLEYMLVTEPPDRRQRGVLHHLCLLVPDVQASFEEAARRSAKIGRPLTATPNIGVNGRWQLNLYDPDGTRTELMEPFTVR